MPEPIIRLRGVTKVFGEGPTAFQALKSVDLDISEGDFVAIMGPSGSGKSTTMNILGCLDLPTSGEFLFRGVHVERMSRDQLALLRRRYLGFVFQGFNLLARTDALENVELPLLYRGMDKAARKAAAMDALEQVGLKEWWDHTPAELSGGAATARRHRPRDRDPSTGTAGGRADRQSRYRTVDRNHGIPDRTQPQPGHHDPDGYA
ncbi:MAG TPA: ABC transporter ATP-binding protein [Novosphingobium sp.]|mgnify:CR=1 FL=1|nr:ABC transporter ATP-binding protein [Novosphingobium sp.]